MRVLKVPRNAVTNAKPIRKRFVIHEHHATRLHFDLRLEIGGTGKSWAVPKGPSMDPDDKRLAVAVPDHSLRYFKFEGTLAEGTYGAGEVRIWDSGKYETLVDPQIQYDEGRIEFTFLGKKVRGEFILVRMSGPEKRGWQELVVDQTRRSVCGYRLGIEDDFAGEVNSLCRILARVCERQHKAPSVSWGLRCATDKLA
jgi:bifunctional non-homologous end joining protein LigD